MAIAFDNHKAALTDINGVAYTMGAGAGGLLLVAVNQGGLNSPTITAFSYGGSALTRLYQNTCSGSEDLAVYYLNNPPTGSNSFSATYSSGGVSAYAILSYTGTGGLPVSPNSNESQNCGGTITNVTLNLTVLANSWTAMFVMEADGLVSAGTNTTLRDGLSGTGSGDSNGALSAGSHSNQLSWVSGAAYTAAMVEVPLPGGGNQFLTLLGVGA